VIEALIRGVSGTVTPATRRVMLLRNRTILDKYLRTFEFE
jgi:hypothetical protein